MDRLADFILVRCTLTDSTALAQAASDFCAQSPIPMRRHRAAWSDQTQVAYVYGHLAASTMVTDEQLASVSQQWQQVCPQAKSAEVSRLALAFDAPGQSLGQGANYHYVVETDPEPGWADEIARWYDMEHMPGLAAVPGCIHARRLLNHDNGPLSFACYDLVSDETLASPAWLAVRATAWSDKARPHFTNTRRTMMRVMG